MAVEEDKVVVRVHLTVKTRKEFSKLVVIPASWTEKDPRNPKILRRAYDILQLIEEAADGSDFEEDYEHWEPLWMDPEDVDPSPEICDDEKPRYEIHEDGSVGLY